MNSNDDKTQNVGSHRKPSTMQIMAVSHCTSNAAKQPRPTTPAKSDGLLVIGAGFGRTGTSSLQEALSILGYGPVYHMREVIKDPHGVEKWQHVADLKLEGKNVPKDVWDDVFWGYQSTVDLPAATHWEDLMEIYPRAKIILSIRDPDKWFDSVVKTIAPATPVWRFLYKLTLIHDYKFANMAYHNVWKPMIGENIDDARNKSKLIDAFNKHNERVKSKVPPTRLLVFDVKQGWKPLCDFLECDVPTRPVEDGVGVEEKQPLPFPHVWELQEFEVMLAKKRRKCIKRLAIGCLVGVAMLAVGIKKSSKDSN